MVFLARLFDHRSPSGFFSPSSGTYSIPCRGVRGFRKRLRAKKSSIFPRVRLQIEGFVSIKKGGLLKNVKGNNHGVNVCQGGVYMSEWILVRNNELFTGGTSVIRSRLPIRRENAEEEFIYCSRVCWKQSLLWFLSATIGSVEFFIRQVLLSMAVVCGFE